MKPTHELLALARVVQHELHGQEKNTGTPIEVRLAVYQLVTAALALEVAIGKVEVAKP